jgi:hypothetical protein
MRARSLVLPALAAVALSTTAAAGPPPRTVAGASAAVRPGGLSGQPAMRPWRYHGANPDGWWCRRGACNGVRDGTVFVARELPLIAGLGVTILRLEFPWALLEPRRGAYDWRRSDHIVRLARRHKVRLLPVIVYTPAWAARSRIDPPAARDFARVARAFARRYGRWVDHYELWNEPDLPRYWSGAQGDYVRKVLVPGYAAVKRADRGAKVIVGPSSSNPAWLEGLYDLGGGRSFDVVAYHDYSGDRQAVQGSFAVHGVLAAHGQGRKPVWLGEYGVQEPGVDDVRHQALIRAVLTETAPLALALWYTLRDDHAMTCCPPRAVVSETYGLVTDAYRKKGSYEVMRRLLAGRRGG